MHEHARTGTSLGLNDLGSAQEESDGMTTGDRFRGGRPFDHDWWRRYEQLRWAFIGLYGIPADIGKATKAGMIHRRRRQAHVYEHDRP